MTDPKVRLAPEEPRHQTAGTHPGSLYSSFDLAESLHWSPFILMMLSKVFRGRSDKMLSGRFS